MTSAIIALSQDGHTLQCAGEWVLSGVQALPEQFAPLLRSARDPLQINAAGVTALDTVGAFRLRQLVAAAVEVGKHPALVNLSPRHQEIFSLIDDKLKQSSRSLPKPVLWNWLELLGHWGVRKWNNCLRFLMFIGEVVIQFGKMRARGVQNLWHASLKIMQTAGCQALPIVATMSFLIGVVIAYQLGVQLRLYGADIYVVDASGIAILREFAPLMTAVIVAGRTSTAFAALIGAMKVNDELDALATMGISAVERIVLPRISGLLVALPLLTVWAVIFSLLGSMIMAKGQLDISFSAFLQRFSEAVELKHYVLGLVKTPVFAAIIALVGCFQGFQVGITADSVGFKTTAAAVQAIFLIIVADAFFSVLYSWRGL